MCVYVYKCVYVCICVFVSMCICMYICMNKCIGYLNLFVNKSTYHLKMINIYYRQHSHSPEFLSSSQVNPNILKSTPYIFHSLWY